MQLHLLGYSEATISRILDGLEQNNYPQEVVIVQNMEVKESIPFATAGISYKKIFWQEWNFDPDKFQCIPAVYSPTAKMKVIEFFQHHCNVSRENYFTVVHPSSVIAPTAFMGKGCVIEPATVIASFANIGFAVYVNRASTIGHHTVIGDFVSIGPGCHVAGHCTIEAGVSLGIGTVVFDHIRIGKNSIIGGGSVVTKDIPENTVAWGNPCKVIKNIPVE